MNGTGQFLAYGTFSTPPYVMDITNGINHNGFKTAVTWVSSAQQDDFPIESYGAPGETGGLITAYGSTSGAGVPVWAQAANPDGSLVIAPSASFNCPLVPFVPATATNPAVIGTCNEETIVSPLLVSLTAFNAGLNTTNWLITAPSATGTPNVINCGPAATVSQCVASYPVGTQLILTAPAEPGVAFGGWSWDCTPNVPVTAAGPNSCTVILGSLDGSTSNVSVGAIFNNATQ